MSQAKIPEAPYLLIVVLVTSTVASCSPDPSCAAPSGTYEIEYVQLYGNCGDLPPRVLEASPERVTSFNPPCEGTVVWSDNFCRADAVATCPREDVGAGFYDQQHSESDYSQDASMRVGAYDVTIFAPDGSIHCHSTYSVTATRQTGPAG
jgi:hypothetical protein